MSLPLLSQLAHVELTTSTPAESLQFWTQVVGLEETAQAGSRCICAAGEIGFITRCS